MAVAPADIDRDALVQAARAARRHAYAPYSNYKVGAALLASDGQIFTGCNVENAAYPCCTCAERVAITSAVAAGVRDFIAMAVVTANSGTPCGTCRQVMNEFAPDLLVILADEHHIQREYILRDLLPDGFGPEHLS